MNSTQENLMVLGILVVMASLGGLVVGLLSSETLRQEGLRNMVKRWLGH